jgi:hypothetical protein
VNLLGNKNIQRGHYVTGFYIIQGLPSGKDLTFVCTKPYQFLGFLKKKGCYAILGTTRSS